MYIVGLRNVLAYEGKAVRSWTVNSTLNVITQQNVVSPITVDRAIISIIMTFVMSHFRSCFWTGNPITEESPELSRLLHHLEWGWGN